MQACHWHNWLLFAEEIKAVFYEHTNDLSRQIIARRETRRVARKKRDSKRGNGRATRGARMRKSEGKKYAYAHESNNHG